MADLRRASTRILREELSHYDELEEFKKTFLPALKNESASWKAKINEIIQVNHYTKTQMANLCGVSGPAVGKWCNGALPSSREDFIRVGFAAHYNLNEMNFFLQRYGKYPAFYAKSLEDSVCIFVLNSETLPHTYECCLEVISEIRNRMSVSEDDNSIVRNTDQLNSELVQLKTVAELEEFVRDNVAAYKTPYAKFYAYVNAFILANNMDYVTNKAHSVDSLATAQNWSSSMRQCVSAIRQKKWFPLRRKVIALGLHLNMIVDQINEMLQLAQMEPLCAKNLVESAVMFAVDDAELNELICCDGGTELCDHVRMILKELDLPDAEKLLNDL